MPSRHQIVRNMDVDEELDDYDGDYDEGDGDGDDAQMQESTVRARAILGDSFTDAEIKDSLWHYYYDVDKTVNYLLNKKTGQQQQKSASTSTKAKEPALLDSSECSRSKCPRNFFYDCPWFNIPPERKADIFVEPLYPRMGLLGGSSRAAPKTSKLAALAAARKKKENEKAAADSKPVSSSAALLDRLSIKSPSTQNASVGTTAASKDDQETVKASGKHKLSTTARKYPKRERREPSPVPSPEAIAEPKDDSPPAIEDSNEEPLIVAKPSSFAQAIFSSRRSNDNHEDSVKMHYNMFPEHVAENPFAGPSPDDIVAKAQSSSKGLKPATTKSKKTPDKSVDGVSKQLEKATIDQLPRVKSKNLDVVAEYEKLHRKNAANFVVIGHVDAGKSTLMGRLLYDLKVVDQRTIDKYKKEAENIGKSSFALAWILDQGSEERARGVTIDIATNRFETTTTVFTILDAPGHKDFVPNMIAGASQADFAVLVVDASTGSFESGLKGQTKEHALLARSLGVTRMVVAINKLDTVSWSQDRHDEIAQQTSAFLIAAGFSTKHISFVPCSGLHGDNIVHASTVPEATWYKGPTLVGCLEAAAVPRTPAFRGPLRMPISDIMTGGVPHPLSLSGRLTSGNVQVGDRIVTVPSGAAGYVRAIEVDSEPADFAVAGQNATLHIGGDAQLDPSVLRIGDVVCNPNKDALTPRASFAVKALAFAHLTPMYASVIVGRLDVQARIEALVAILDKASGEVARKKPRLVKPGEVARLRVVVEVEGGLPVEAGARIVLRAGGETVATGLVE